jgi:hypothetical protein
LSTSLTIPLPSAFVRTLIHTPCLYSYCGGILYSDMSKTNSSKTRLNTGIAGILPHSALVSKHHGKNSLLRENGADLKCPLCRLLPNERFTARATRAGFVRRGAILDFSSAWFALRHKHKPAVLAPKSCVRLGA